MRYLPLILVLLFTSCFAGQVLIGLQGKFVLLEESNGFVDAKELERLGLTFVLSEVSGRAYLIFEKKIVLLTKDGNVTVDFLDVYKDSAKFVDKKVFIKTEVLQQVLKLRAEKTPSGQLVLLDSVPILRSANFEKNRLRLDFVGFVSEQMVSTRTTKGKLVVEISPCISFATAVDPVKIQTEATSVKVELELGVDVEPVMVSAFEPGALTFELRMPMLGKEWIANGVYWQQTTERIGNKDVLVNYLWIDPTVVELRPAISSSGIGTLESVDAMVIKNNAIAGVNASYFDPNTAMPIGLLIVDGKILQAPYGDRPVFVYTYAGTVHIERFYFDINVRIGQLLFIVKGINTVAIGEVLIFTKEFGLPIPKRDDMLYFVVEKGKVVSRGWTSKAPDAGFVLAISNKYEKYLQEVRPGDPVEYVINTNFPYRIKHAVEAGPLLLYQGAPIPDRNQEKNRYGGNIARVSATRTLIATTQDGKAVLVVISDQNGTGGVNYDELVDFCMSKGFYSAMNFDGGSSSVMVIKDKIVSRTSTGWTRLIPVSLLVVQKSD
ncbi:MAG: phosphodiester glycosidase family protein [Thermotoga caldifontis]|uniref:phosphodiester glycosidase family protein n=1 Tax=Thermotoga caldifontis TaxID=1508419 RepID=UPI003C7B69A2